MIRRSDNYQHHYGVQRDHPFGTDDGVQLRHPRVETSIQRSEDMGTLQDFSPPSTPIAEKSGKKRRKRGIHCGSAKHIWCTTPHSRRASRGDKWSTHYCPSNTYKGLQDRRNGTSQFSPYHLQHSGNGTIITDDYDHERYAGGTKYTSIFSNQTYKVKEEVRLLELRE